MPNHGDQITVAACLDPNDTKPILCVLIGNPLDQPRQCLSIGWIGLRLHDARRLALNYSTR